MTDPLRDLLAKLEWSRDSGGSERQRGDVRGILAAVGSGVDREYVETWVKELGLEAEWALVARDEGPA